MKKGLLLCVLWVLALVSALPSLAEVTADVAVEAEPMPTALYVGIAQTNLAIRTEMSSEAEAVGYLSKEERVQVVSYEPSWLYVVKGNDEKWVAGYVPRQYVWDLTSRQEDILPYGATPAAYSAVVGEDTPLYLEPSDKGESPFTFTKGARVAILDIQDGWAKVVYLRQYGYFYLGAVEELTPVYDAQTAQSGDLLGAFVSFYSLSTEGLNPNRMINIDVACEYISIELSEGYRFSFNGVAGPYQPRYGYLEAPSFFNGETVPSHGGGTCQVSSTLYNTLLPLGEGITVLYRRAHGPSGAAYLPHGVDAAVGNDTLDLVFRNDYGFAVRIDAVAHDGVLYIALLKA